MEEPARVVGCPTEGAIAKPDEDYEWIEVESYAEEKTGGLHGRVHLRPTPGGRHPSSLRVEHPKKITDPDVHPIGTRFRIRAKLTDRENGGAFLYISWRWAYEVVN